MHYTNANNLTQATLAYMEAEQLVDELGDDYAAGLLYNQMGTIYRDYYDFPKALESYCLSTEHYHKVNRLESQIQLYLQVEFANVYN